MKKLFKKSLSLILVIATLVSVISITGITSSAASQVYYPIDFSADVIKSRILSVPGTKDCGLVSICTIEAYLYGATTTAEKNKVYDAVINKNLGTTSGKPNNNAVQSWGALGYATTGYGNFSLQTLYDQLAQGYPCLVHRTSSAGEHWSVVCGYTGSTSKLEKSGFIVVDIEDITPFKKTLTSWQGSNTLDNIGYRKNGISIIMNTSGIRMAINHPKVVHPYGNGHGVYGYITSTAKLTSVTVRVSNANTGAYVFNKTLNPAATSYNIYKLDSSMTFAKWAKGNYYYTVAVIDANGNSRVYEKFFTISSSWPATVTGAKHTFSFNANGGSGSMSSITLEHGGSLTIPACKFTRSGYTFSGYNVYRSDGKWYSSGSSWLTESEIVANGSSKVVYPAGKVYVINNSWTKGGAIGANYTFYPIWTASHTHSYTSKVTKDPTCTAAGVRTYTCSCGDSYTEAIAKTAHSYTAKVTKEPTCAVVGVRTYTCSCGDSYTEAIAKIAHSYTAKVTKEPTCAVAGVRTYTCSCGDSYTENIATVDHSFTNYVVYEYSCTKLSEQIAECDYGCGTKDVQGFPGYGPHRMTDWTYNSDCGREWRYCTVGLGYGPHNGECGYAEYRTLTVDPKVTSDGAVITVRGLKGMKDLFIAEGEYSSYSEIKGNYIVSATNKKIDTETWEYSYTVPTKGIHTVVIRYIDSNLPDIVLTLDVSYHTHAYLPEVTKAATCTEKGVRTYSCTCGDSYTEAIAALGHDDGRWVTAKEATTSNEGLKELRCTVCSYLLDTEMIPKLPEIHTHSYTSEITLAPTCTGDGTITYSCSCGDSYDLVLSAKGHDDGAWVITKPATQTEEGLSELKCTVCGFVLSAKVIPVLEEDDSFENPFTDVKDSYWFAEAVFYCVKKGYASGMTETTFVPNGKLTRAQFLTLLAKLDGAKLSDYEGIDSGFNDVRANHWYNEVVCWAVEMGYTSGLSDTKFGPNSYITRAQLARFFYVYSEKNGINIENTADTSAFPDAAKVPSWAKIPVEWAVNAGLISGVAKDGKDYLDPNGTATRAQAAVMFKAFDSFRGVEE